MSEAEEWGKPCVQDPILIVLPPVRVTFNLVEETFVEPGLLFPTLAFLVSTLLFTRDFFSMDIERSFLDGGSIHAASCGFLSTEHD